MRIFLTILVPLFLPTVLYILWLVALKRPEAAGAADWRGLPWPWLALAGVVATAALLFVLRVHITGSPQGVYVPPRYIDGRIEPGHVEPAPPAR